MSERYKQVKLYDNFSFCPTCPVDILKGAIYIDTITNKAVFQLKFVNMQEKHIKALYIQIKGYDDLGKELENKEYSYLDLNIKAGQEFGTEQLKELNNNTIRNIELTINKVIYVDNEVWSNKNIVAYGRTNLQRVDDNMLFIASKKATEQGLQLNNIYYPIQNEKYWTCVCGTYNSNNNDKCYKCNCSKDLVFSEFCKNELEKKLKEYKEQEIQKQEIQKRNFKKIKKVIVACIPIIIILVIILYFVNIEKNKLDKYNKAIETYNHRNYDKAIELFEDLEDYKDSKAYIENANIEKDDLNTINKCLSYYSKQSEYFYEECKKLGWKIHYKQAEQYISQLKNYGYYSTISSLYSLRENYLKQLDNLKTDKFENEKEIILKINNKYEELYNFYISYPKEDNYTDYVNEAYKFYEVIENYNDELEKILKIEE